jgi:hypothetical protein
MVLGGSVMRYLAGSSANDRTLGGGPRSDITRKWTTGVESWEGPARGLTLT